MYNNILNDVCMYVKKKKEKKEPIHLEIKRQSYTYLNGMACYFSCILVSFLIKKKKG